MAKADMDNKCLVEIEEFMTSYPSQAEAMARGYTTVLHSLIRRINILSLYFCFKQI